MSKIVAKKKFGQNFLIDTKIQSDIVNVADIRKDETVVEVGPGTGAITKLLVKKAKKVIAYEIDRNLISLLKNSIKDENFELLNQDFLESKLPKTPYKVVANIPYYITSEILFKLYENYKNIELAVLMVQKDVALRLIAEPKTTHYSKLTATTQLYGNVIKAFDVPNTSFDPTPKVESSIIIIKFNKTVIEEHLKISKFIAQCFQFRRKLLTANLKNIYDSSKILKAYSILNFDKNIRSQEMSLQQFIELYKLLD